MGYRYIKLKNRGSYVARTKLSWSGTQDGNAGTGTYEESGYHDVLVYGERTIDMKDQAHFPDGAAVTFTCFVVAGRDKTASFTFNEQPGDTITYQCDGTTLFNSLKQV
ncbi:hypothetical protein [Bifidobacterium sp.]|jgi:hypothetical protein|uniref:hypothetical protein n=1 Tax=Bifidobacterium sp. TaxID=41200 RepID=UPI0025C2F909|nr:hypothetical protein [Bifidobacterium sp.]MCI1634773.1 hypothetical protein [Bifidobacterium sp.]